MLLKRENIGYKLGKDQKLINLKLYGRSKEDMESLINVVPDFHGTWGWSLGWTGVLCWC